MPIFRKDGQNILFVHVPKAGGSTVERVFGNSGYQVLYRDPKTGPKSVNRLRRCSPQHMHAEMLDRNFRLNAFDLILMVTREPLARFRSEYGMRNADRLQHGTAADVDQWADKAFKKYLADSFVFDNHLRPQSEFKLEKSDVYRLEDGLDTLVADLNSRYGLGLDPNIPRVMDRKSASGSSSSDVEISDQLQTRLIDFYHDDFTRFGYPLPEDNR
ncbi:sulfotransferase family 2 domain-containing protein [Arthrobacter castelli]|uniref:sulfotransferase family 2 domain-containing protein n=1 Tax=Arthrobacter castelli TaxID=271431 RepID=UPI0004126684|nr:sulfotransferase family 2 domain-containing protein [Arthrobacter castelli]